MAYVPSVPVHVLVLTTLAVVAGTSASANVDHGYTGHEPSAWSRVLHRCHRIGCTSHLSHAIRHDLGISDHQPVRVHYGDTTWIWAKGKHGIVHTFNS